MYRGKLTRAFLSSTTSISVIIVSRITVICISHGRVLVLTPVDENERNQGRQSVEGRHLFPRVFSGAKGRDSLSQGLRPQILSRKPFGTNCPKRATFGLNEGRRAWGGSKAVWNREGWGAVSVPTYPSRTQFEGARERSAAPRTLPERVAGSGSGPRTVASPPTPELHIPVAPPRFWLAPRTSSARKGVARLALGGWAVEGVHVDSPLAPPFKSYQDPPRPGSSGFFHPDRLLRLGWACPCTRSHWGLASGIQSSSHVGPVHNGLCSPGGSEGPGKRRKLL